MRQHLEKGKIQVERDGINQQHQFVVATHYHTKSKKSELPYHLHFSQPIIARPPIDILVGPANTRTSCRTSKIATNATNAANAGYVLD